MNALRFYPFSYIILNVLLLFAIDSFGQINVVPFKSGNPSTEKDGIIYCLPRTIIKVELEVVKTELFKGPYADFAPRLLGINNVITENSASYSISDVVLSTYAEADPNQFYFIEFDEKVKDSRSIMVTMSENGFISGYADIGPIKNEVRNAMISGDFEAEKLKPFRDLLKPVLIEKVDTVIRRISIDTTTVEEKVLKRSVAVKTVEQQAREAADLIYRIEDNKFSLITGYQEVNYSRESLEFMLEQLDKMESDYLAMFKGFTKKTSSKYTYYVTPEESKDAMLETICRFSKVRGIDEKTGTGGESVSVIITPLNQNKLIEDFVVKRDKESKKSHGFYYRLPEKARVNVRIGNEMIAGDQFMISQMGLITFLSAGNMSNVRFSSENGTITHAVSE